MKSILPKGKSAYEILIVLIIVLLAVYTHAQEPVPVSEVLSTSTGDRAIDHSQMNHENMIQKKEERTEVHEEHRAQLNIQFQDRITNLASNVKNRLTAGITRLQNITNRLDTRIMKLKNAGTGTTDAEMKLEEAKTALRTAEQKLGEIPSIQRALASDTPRESFKTIREQFLSVRESLKQTHSLLTDTVAILKGERPREKPEGEADENLETATTSIGSVE